MNRTIMARTRGNFQFLILEISFEAHHGDQSNVHSLTIGENANEHYGVDNMFYLGVRIETIKKVG